MCKNQVKGTRDQMEKHSQDAKEKDKVRALLNMQGQGPKKPQVDEWLFGVRGGGDS